DLMQGLINGIKNMGSAAIGAITGVVNGVVNKAKSLLKISSPSRVFIEMGGFISEGVADGIDKMESLATKATERLGLGVEKSFKPNLSVDRLEIARKIEGVNRQFEKGVDVGFSGGSNITYYNDDNDLLVRAVKSLESKLTNLTIQMDNKEVAK